MDADRDLVVVGAGAAGLTAAAFAAAEDLNVLVVEELASGGQQILVSHLTNFPGFPQGISGVELSSRMEEQATAAGAEVTNGSIRAVERKGDLVILTRQEDVPLTCRAAIVATGSAPRPLGVPGEDRYRGRGVSTCAGCDGPFFRDRKVVVVGGGDSACDEALFLATLAREVLLVHRGSAFRAQASIVREVSESATIDVRLQTEVTEILGETMVTGVTLRDRWGGVTLEQTDGVFVFAGSQPRSDVLPGADMDPDGYLVTGPDLATSVAGVFAAGAVRVSSYRQCITAAADGAVAAHAAVRFIRT